MKTKSMSSANTVRKLQPSSAKSAPLNSSQASVQVIAWRKIYSNTGRTLALNQERQRFTRPTHLLWVPVGALAGKVTGAQQDGDPNNHPEGPSLRTNSHCTRVMPSSELKPIILYDIPCTTPGRPWSPNTMITRYAFNRSSSLSNPDRHHLVRYCLGYKGLPFTTVWIELPDIAGLLQSKGITHPPYTLPSIEDPNTGGLIIDSLVIAGYLDETYPETPKVLSPAARTALEGVLDVFSFGSGPNTSANPGAGAGASGDGIDPAPRLVFPILAVERLTPASKAWYHQTRTARLGERWTTMRDACSASPEDRAEKVSQGIEAMREIWRKVTALYDREDGSNGPFALGEEPYLVDFAVAGRVKYMLDGLTPSEVETLTNLKGGSRLGRLVESLERYFKY